MYEMKFNDYLYKEYLMDNDIMFEEDDTDCEESDWFSDFEYYIIERNRVILENRDKRFGF